MRKNLRLTLCTRRKFMCVNA